MKKSWFHAVCSTIAVVLILVFSAKETVFAHSSDYKMKEGETREFEAPDYAAFTYSWSIASGSGIISIQSGTSSKTCTATALSPGEAVLQCVYVRDKGTKREHSYTDTFKIKVEPSEETLGTQASDGLTIHPKELQPNTAYVFVDGVPTLFFLSESSTVKTKDPAYTYDSYILNSVKDGLLDQEINLKIRQSLKQGGGNDGPVAPQLTYYEYYYDPYMYGFIPKSTSAGAENLMVLTERSNGLKHVEGIFATETKSKWSKRRPALYGVFNLDFQKSSEVTGVLYANYGGHLPNDEDILKLDREVHDAEIRSREQEREKRKEKRVLKTCGDCGGTGFCMSCLGTGKVYGRAFFNSEMQRVACSHCRGTKTCPTCHGKRKT